MLTARPLPIRKADTVTEVPNDRVRPGAIPMPLQETNGSDDVATLAPVLDSTDRDDGSPGDVAQADLDRLADDGNPHGQNPDANGT
ncbi:hypothetical protein [Frigoriglobus tundricola]|uniref:Uncharacterized protein n=1 Tax=Frigoriglobus tundricola TaxID=2774151 RepID=A0A6M5YIZ8_9BACT|nr:hypothetical protein [Frigoriglobus tundricola]QJW93233.1 hypothetical protein FTUN_0738 [Frigoriglobus tundricola]